eukprot:scaffold42152_cov48-Phaeocystis_antarctica.AAC.1
MGFLRSEAREAGPNPNPNPNPNPHPNPHPHPNPNPHPHPHPNQAREAGVYFSYSQLPEGAPPPRVGESSLVGT